MNGILGMLELIEGTPLDDDQRNYIEICTRSGEGLLTLLNQVLDFSKCQSGKMTLAAAPMDLHNLISEIDEMLRSSADDKGLSLQCLIGERVPCWIEADEGRLRQVLVNLIGNAIKFTPAGSVTLKVDARDLTGTSARIVFGVTDTGIGIAEEKLNTIFEQFSQAEDSTTRHFGGTGLGLTISEELVSLMGSKIEVSSEEGIGTRFSFGVFVPLAEPQEKYEPPQYEAPLPLPTAEPSQPIIPTPQVLVEAPTPSKPAIEQAEVAPPVSAAQKTESSSHLIQVLVAEDNHVNAILIKLHLEKLGCVVTVVENGVDAVTSMQTGAFDIIFMDWRMPEMDGLEATAAIRKIKTPVAIPIIVVTANAMPGDREQCLAAGVDEYITKPVSSASLREALDRFVVGPRDSRSA
jgi:CheY-like chemotaxis protein